MPRRLFDDAFPRFAAPPAGDFRVDADVADGGDFAFDDVALFGDFFLPEGLVRVASEGSFPLTFSVTA